MDRLAGRKELWRVGGWVGGREAGAGEWGEEEDRPPACAEHKPVRSSRQRGPAVRAERRSAGRVGSARKGETEGRAGVAGEGVGSSVGVAVVVGRRTFSWRRRKGERRR